MCLLQRENPIFVTPDQKHLLKWKLHQTLSCFSLFQFTCISLCLYISPVAERCGLSSRLCQARARQGAPAYSPHAKSTCSARKKRSQRVTLPLSLSLSLFLSLSLSMYDLIPRLHKGKEYLEGIPKKELRQERQPPSNGQIN